MTAQSHRTVWLVCLLSLSLLVLATRAKLAQYGHGRVDAPQITKATKLAEGRQPAHVPVDAIEAAPALSAPVPAAEIALVDLPRRPEYATVRWSPVALRPPPARA